MDPLDDGFDQPTELSPIQVAFPAHAMELMPRYEDIPESFRASRRTKESGPWLDFQAEWFFSGTSKDRLKPREDVDATKAWQHLAAIQGSFEPSHEHKESAVAWLASRWFAAVSPKVGA